MFASDIGKGINPSNVRRGIWMPLKKGGIARALDLYSFPQKCPQHSFAPLESAFNVARMMGHSRSMLVDQVHTQAMLFGVANLAESVTTGPWIRIRKRANGGPT